MSTKLEYVKQDPIKHILTRPDMYVGSKTFRPVNLYVFENDKLVKKTVDYCPALIRLFVEILANAIDNVEREPKMTRLTVTVSPTECSVTNDGCVVAIDKSNAEHVYNHTLIFGHLLSGSNYDDTTKRYTSGRNGLGAKLTNVYSSKFTVEGVDPAKKLKFTQTWTDNMTKTDGPKVCASSLKKGYTAISWRTDFSQFDLKELPRDIVSIYSKYVFDAAMLTGLNVTLNDVKLPNKLNLYLGYAYPNANESIHFENECCKVWVTSADEYEAISFVNGIYTKTGGKHVDAAVEAVCRPLVSKLKGTVTLRDVKKRFAFLVVARLANPEFDSQEKNTLESPNVKLDPISAATVSKIMKWSIGSYLKSLAEDKDKKAVSKIVKDKSMAIDCYDKANNSGGPKSSDCTLIVCEGLSAKTFAVSGISHGLYDKKGRDWFGIYPLRGKLLNTRNAPVSSIKTNVIITNLMKILGLDYSNPDKLDKLNYGRLCVITDADVDGIHIEGLILNFVHSMFPKLLTKGFVVSMKTPILKTISTRSQTGRFFFDERTFEKVSKDGCKVKYYKGLGTTKPEDVKEVFGVKMLEYVVDENTDSSFSTAFDRSKASERRDWLAAYDPKHPAKTLDDEDRRIVKYSVTTLLNDELIKFFHNDCARNIPYAFDGQKESQRKILYAAKKRNLVSDLKVAQFGAYVAEHTNYHHGEQNLFNAIVKMAQSFPGSNNVPLLVPEGQFGTRLSGGEDAASPRYIYTRMSKAFETLFPSEDDELYVSKFEDGTHIEPEFYVPVLPVLLLNGCVGIGSGWLCNVPSFCPKDVVENAKIWMSGGELKPMKPWFAGFSGPIQALDGSKFETKGVYSRSGSQIRVSELPVGLWNDRFKEYCQEHKHVLKVKDLSTTSAVNFELTVSPDFDEKEFERKLTTTYNLNNVVVFDENGKIVKINPLDIFKMWGTKRLELNEKRKAKQLKDLSDKLDLVNDKILFIDLVKKKLVTLTDSETDVTTKLLKRGIKEKSIDTLLSLPVRSVTNEKSLELQRVKDDLSKKKIELEKMSSRDIWNADLARAQKAF